MRARIPYLKTQKWMKLWFCVCHCKKKVYCWHHHWILITTSPTGSSCARLLLCALAFYFIWSEFCRGRPSRRVSRRHLEANPSKRIHGSVLSRTKWPPINLSTSRGASPNLLGRSGPGLHFIHRILVDITKLNDVIDVTFFAGLKH